MAVFSHGHHRQSSPRSIKFDPRFPHTYTHTHASRRARGSRLKRISWNPRRIFRVSSVQETRPTKSRTFNLRAAFASWSSRGPVQLYANGTATDTRRPGLPRQERGARIVSYATRAGSHYVHHPETGEEMVVTFLLSHPINYRAYNI